jgi:hypothetical protein
MTCYSLTIAVGPLRFCVEEGCTRVTMISNLTRNRRFLFLTPIRSFGRLTGKPEIMNVIKDSKSSKWASADGEKFESGLFATRPVICTLRSLAQLAAEVTVNTALQDIDTQMKRPAATSSVPASHSATGTAGQIAVDSTHIYFCLAANTWLRIATDGTFSTSF